MSELKLNVVDTKAVSPSVAKVAAYVKTKAEDAATINAGSGEGLPQVAQKVTNLNRNQVQEAVSRINEYVQQSERRLDFRLDEESGQTVIRVYDKVSDELIRQIPGDLALHLAQKLNDEEPSLLFSAQV